MKTKNTFVNELRKISSKAVKNHPKVVEKELRRICKMNAKSNNMQFEVHTIRNDKDAFVSPDGIFTTAEEFTAACERLGVHYYRTTEMSYGRRWWYTIDLNKDPKGTV